jgi:hypothetical protein
MKSNYILFTILFLLIGSGSFFFGLISCQSVNNPKPQQDIKGKSENNEKTAASLLSRPRNQVASLLIPEVESEKGVQKELKEKSQQIHNVMETVKTMNGIINILQSAQSKNNYFVEASVNPLEALAPVDFVFKKISGTLLWIYSALVFQKILLSFSSFLIFILVIPICALVTIIILWTYKNKAKVHRIVIASVIISLIIPFAIPFSINTSSFMGNKILAKKINALTVSIEENGKKASVMENDVVRSRKTGNSIINYMGRAIILSDAIAEDVINYNIICLFIFIFIPVLTLIFIFFLTRYASRLILGKQRTN